MQNLWGEDRFDGMANGMSKIDEISQTRLTFVNGNNVCLDGDGGDDDAKEEILCW